MIVEDEHGNDIYIERYDREPEPPDVPPPLDLDQVAGHYHQALAEDMTGIPEHSREALAAVPELLARLSEAEGELAESSSGEQRYEYAVTLGAAPAADHPFLASVEGAEWIRERPEHGTSWVRTVTTSPWHRYEPPPF